MADHPGTRPSLDADLARPPTSAPTTTAPNSQSQARLRESSPAVDTVHIPGEPPQPTSRKNSILVTDPKPDKKAAAVHPHFVDNALPHRVVPPVANRSASNLAQQVKSGSPAPADAPAGQGAAMFGGYQLNTVSSPVAPSPTAAVGPFGPSVQPQSSQSSAASSRVPSRPNLGASPSTTDSEVEQQPHAPVVGRATSKQPSDPRIPMDDGKIHILIGATGSLHISSVKQIVAKLHSIYGDRAAIQVIVTTAAENMLHHTDVASHVQTWHDKDEWLTWRSRSDPVIHIELRRWADILVIAPLSANTLGKIAMGLCDNLLTNVVRAWNAQYPILVAPAMVSYAYNHPATRSHLRTIREEMKWIEILRPVEKVAGSTGGIGMGGMMAWNEIVDRIVQKLGGYPNDDDDEDDDEVADQPGNEEDDEEDDDDTTNVDDADDAFEDASEPS